MTSRVLMLVLSITLACLVSNVISHPDGYGSSGAYKIFDYSGMSCGTTEKECQKLADASLKELPPGCYTYGIFKFDSKETPHKFAVRFDRCFDAGCGENTRVIEDLSKPYPACCARCEIIDPSKPAVIRPE